MEDRPLVSILVPEFQRGKLCAMTVDCALQSTYEKIEIILVDNCSQDGSFEYLKERYENESRVRLFRNEKNLGPVGNWIRCLEHASGEFIKILWSDDLMAKNFIEKAVAELVKCPKAAFVYSAVMPILGEDTIDNVNDNKKVSRLVGSIYYYKYPLAYRIGKTGFYNRKYFINGSLKNDFLYLPKSPGCALFRRNTLKIHDLIPNPINYEHNRTGAGTDELMFLEALDDSEGFIYIDEPLNYFRSHAGSITCTDSEIGKGYLMAKESYMTKRNMKKDYKWVCSELITYEQGYRKVFSIKTHYEILTRYFPEVAERYDFKEYVNILLCIISRAMKYIYIHNSVKVNIRKHLFYKRKDRDK